MWHENGGAGPRTFVLLHGLGATAAVWIGVREALAERGLGSWIAPDLCGHGRSAWQEHYSVGQLAAAVAELIRDRREVFVIGHSLGAYLGLALSSGWFGVEVQGVLGIGPKITWSAQDLQGAREIASRPVRWYPTRDEALARYRRVSGLDSRVAPDEHYLAGGITSSEQGWRLSQDPRTFAVAGAPFDSLIASSRARVILARGEGDQMVSEAQLRTHAAHVNEIAGAGHNAHVEKPAEIASLAQQLTLNQ